MLHICVRSEDEGPSSGITTVGDDTREAVVLRDVRVCVDDFDAS